MIEIVIAVVGFLSGMGFGYLAVMFCGYILEFNYGVLGMGWLRKRWAERSTRLQLFQLGSLAVSLGTGVPIEALVGLVTAVSGVGMLTPDKSK